MSDPLSEALLDDDDSRPFVSSGLERAAIDRVQQLVAEGSLDEATSFLDESLREEGGGLALRALRAKLDYVAGHYSSAAVRYASVAIEAEEIPSLRLNEALCLLRAARYDDAFGVLFRLVTRGMQSARLWGYLGVALEHRGQYQDAGAAYLAGGYPEAAHRMRRRKLDSTLAREGAERLERDELATGERHDQPEGHGAQETRGIEALRDPNQRTSPPARFETDRGVTEMPRSFAGLLVEPESGHDGDARPPRTLLDLTLAALLVVPTDTAWSRHPSGVVCASVPPSAPVHYDPRSFVARSSAGSRSDAAATNKGFAKLGAGRIVLAPRHDAETLHLLDLAGETLVVSDRYVVAFAAPEGGPLRHEAPWPLEMLRFSGEGMLVLGLPDAFVTYDVRSGDDFELRAASLVGWAGELTVALDGDGTVAPPHRRVRFTGNGTVLLLTRSLSATSSMIPHSAGHRLPNGER